MCAINDPPLGSKNQAARDLNFRTVLRAITAVKEADIPGVVEQVFTKQGEAGSLFFLLFLPFDGGRKKRRLTRDFAIQPTF